jgi:hypothetical protein
VYGSKRPVTRCIFCQNAYANSEEDYWPKWLQKLIPPKYASTDFRTNIGGDWRVTHSLKVDPSRHTLRVVCRTCNNVWMSQIQNRASSILKPLVKGHNRVLSRSDAETLSAWAAMTAMVIEHNNPATISTTKNEHHRFFTEKAAPDNWYIGVVRTSQAEHPNYYHSAMMEIHKDADGMQVSEKFFMLGFWLGHTGFFVKKFPALYAPTIVDMASDLVTHGFTQLHPSLGVAPIEQKSITPQYIEDLIRSVQRAFVGHNS